MSKELREILAVQQELDIAKRPKREHAEGWEPGVAWDGNEGTITSTAMPAENAPDWESILKIWGLDPAQFTVVEPVLFNVWGDPLGNLNRQWKGKVIQKRAAKGEDFAALLAEVKRYKPKKVATLEGDVALIVALSDFQMGKGEGGGSAGIVQRFLTGIGQVEQRWKELVKLGRPLDHGATPNARQGADALGDLRAEDCCCRCSGEPRRESSERQGIHDLRRQR